MPRSIPILFAAALLWLSAPLRGETADGRALFEAGAFSEAREAFLGRLEGDPTDPEALYYLGRLTPENARSQTYFRQLLEAHPAHPLADDALLELAEGTYAGSSGRYIRARGLYRRLVASYPGSPLVPRALCRIGATFLVTRQPDSARVAFERVVAKYPQSEVALHARRGLIESLELLGDSTRARAVASALTPAEADSPGLDTRASVAPVESEGPSEPRGRATPASDPYWVQVGAFRRAENVRAICTRLSGKGYRTRTLAAGARSIQIVYAGPYRDRASAEADLDRIQSSEHIQCKVVSRPLEDFR